MCSKYTDIKLQTLLDKDFIWLLEKIIRGGIGNVMGGRYVKFDEKKDIIYRCYKSIWPLNETTFTV